MHLCSVQCTVQVQPQAETHHAPRSTWQLLEDRHALHACRPAYLISFVTMLMGVLPVVINATCTLQDPDKWIQKNQAQVLSMSAPEGPTSAGDVPSASERRDQRRRVLLANATSQNAASARRTARASETPPRYSEGGGVQVSWVNKQGGAGNFA